MVTNLIGITHTAVDGTLAAGTSRGDRAGQVLKVNGFRWSGTIGSWYIRGSRDRAPQRWVIDQAAEALRDAGYEVTVDVDETPRATADVERDRADRAEDRADRLTERGTRKLAAGAAILDQVKEGYAHIPLGQPMLVDHYSYNRDRNHRERLHRKEGVGHATRREGKDALRRADATVVNQDYRETGPVTERRIKDLNAELRGVRRSLDGHTRNFRNGLGEIYSSDVTEPAAGDYRDRLLARAEHIGEQVTYWTEHLQNLVAGGGHRVWGPDDFTVGDYAVISTTRFMRVTRVNKKSLTVQTDHSWTDTVPYDKVRGKRTAEEMRAVTARVADAESAG